MTGPDPWLLHTTEQLGDIREQLATQAARQDEAGRQIADLYRRHCRQEQVLSHHSKIINQAIGAIQAIRVRLRSMEQVSWGKWAEIVVPLVVLIIILMGKTAGIDLRWLAGR